MPASDRRCGQRDRATGSRDRRRARIVAVARRLWFAALVALIGATVFSSIVEAAPGARAAARLQTQRLEPFDPQRDYGYDLAAADGSVHSVELSERGFSWPNGISGDTAFLELEIESARPDSPGIRLRQGEIDLRQVFEDGARGRRFVDVSPFLRAATAAGAEVTLEADGLRFRPGPARLVAYRNTPLDGSRVLVLAPHPDDAEIGAFGLYSSTDSDVVTVTSGDAGDQSFKALFEEPGEHYRAKGWIRTWDSITVPFFGGVAPGRARNLGYYDATLGRMWRTRPQPVEPLYATLERPGFYRELNIDSALRARAFAGTWPGLVGDLVAELERVRPRVVAAPHPLLDRHRDHQFATIALLDALESWDGECELWLYTNHAVGNESFPLGPRTAMTGLPPWEGGALFFSRLYSHPLDVAARRRKMVALEAMHDLRPFDPRDGAAPGARDVSARDRREALRDREEAARYDYFRRGPRPNELFFVATREDAARLRTFLMDRAHALDGLRFLL